MPELRAAFDEAIAQLTAEGSPYATTTEVRNDIEYTVYTQAPATMLEIFAAGAAHGDKEFVLYEGERWSFKDLMQQAASSCSWSVTVKPWCWMLSHGAIWKSTVASAGKKTPPCLHCLTPPVRPWVRACYAAG